MTVNINDRITTSTFRQLLAVQIISTIISMAGSMIDGIIIARFLTPTEAAAYGLSTPASIVMVAFAFILAAGSAAVCGNHMGRGEVHVVSRIMNKVIVLSIMAAAFFTIFIAIFPGTVASFLGAQGEVHKALTDYIRTFSFSSFGIILTPVMIGFMQMDRDGKRAMRSAIVFLITSTSLDLFNVLVLKWGMTGMGLTTAVSYVVSTTVLFLHFRKKDSALKLSLKQFTFSETSKIIRIGLPSAIYHLSNFVKVLATNLIIISVGTTADLFTNTVLHSINPIIMGFIGGSGSATLLMCSIIVGEENRRSLLHTYKYILRTVVIIGIAVTAVIILLSDVVISGFFCAGDSAIFRSNVTTMIRIDYLFITFALINAALVNYFQSAKRVFLANLLCIIDNIVLLVGVMLIMSNLFGINGVWMSFAIAEFLGIVFLYFYAWLKNRKMPRSIYDIMLMPDDFGVKKDKRINITITKNEEIENIYNTIISFCDRQGVDERRAKAAGLCMEELAAMAFENGSSKKKAYVDIYLTYNNGELKLRMRDNCRPIDVSILSPDYEAEDEEKVLGIRLVNGMSKDVNYSVVLGLNVFIITL